MKQSKCLKLVLLLSIIEGFLSILATLLIPSDPKNALIFELSLNRIIIILFSMVIILSLTYLFIKPARLLNLSTIIFHSKRSVYILSFVVLFFFLLLWVTIWLPEAYLGTLQASFVRIKPLLIWLELIIFQLALIYKKFSQTLSKISKQALPGKKPLLFFIVSLLGLWTFILSTKIGLVKDTAFWNVAGVPISGIQLAMIILFMLIYWFFDYWPGNNGDKRPKKTWILLIPVLIYILTVAIWGFTPMLKHYFSLEPTAPTYQPYPYSDARHHDYGAISILRGQGVYFKGYTDKPLYMAFLSALHLIAQQDYVKLTWLHVITLGIIPVLLYLLGKRVHSQLLGIVLALMIIFQQRNAILLSYVIASANPKLFVTEVVMLLGMLLLAILAFNWIKTKEKKLALLLGGTIGALSLIRINPVFMLPLMAVIGFFQLRSKRKIFIQHMLLLLVGFMLVFSPWIISGVNPQGESWFIIKIMDVLKTRYSQDDQTYNFNDFVTQSGLVDEKLPSITSNNTTFKGHLKLSSQVDTRQINSPLLAVLNSFGQNLNLMGNHFLHNLSTSFLVLPDSLKILNSKDISQEPYRVEGNDWDGNFTIEQQALIVSNLIIIGIGLTESWTKHRWAGLVPLFIFLMYNVSLSFAMNSGSRYIVPINWVVFLYYAIGLVYLMKMILGSCQIITHIEGNARDEQLPNKLIAQTPLIVIFAGLILLASIVPIVNLVVPRFVQPPQVQVDLDLLEISGDTIHPGTIFYPYYTANGKMINFDFLEGNHIFTLQIEKQFLKDQDVLLHTNTPAIIGLKQEGEIQGVSDVFLVEENETRLIWQNVDLNRPDN